jgi:hypothetical protein
MARYYGREKTQKKKNTERCGPGEQEMKPEEGAGDQEAVAAAPRPLIP